MSLNSSGEIHEQIINSTSIVDPLPVRPELKQAYKLTSMVQYLDSVSSAGVNVYGMNLIEGSKEQGLHLQVHIAPTVDFQALKINPEEIIVPNNGIDFHGYVLLPSTDPKQKPKSFPEDVKQAWLRHAVPMVLNCQQEKIIFGYDTGDLTPLSVMDSYKHRGQLAEFILHPLQARKAFSAFLKTGDRGSLQATMRMLQIIVNLPMDLVPDMPSMMQTIIKRAASNG